MLLAWRWLPPMRLGQRRGHQAMHSADTFLSEASGQTRMVKQPLFPRKLQAQQQQAGCHAFCYWLERASLYDPTRRMQAGHMLVIRPFNRQLPFWCAGHDRIAYTYLVVQCQCLAGSQAGQDHQADTLLFTLITQRRLRAERLAVEPPLSHREDPAGQTDDAQGRRS